MRHFAQMADYKRLLNSQLGRNILTNYLAVIWMGGLSILLIPFYLRLLGAQQWGVVAICMALQAFFTLLDAGLSQIMPRDIARVAHSFEVRLKTFIVYQRAYIALALGGFIVGQLVVPWLVDHWFGGGKTFTAQDIWAFHLVLLQFLFQFSNNSNIGYWNGMQMQSIANIRQCFFGLFKHVGALCFVYFWRADALAYLLPFAVITSIEYVSNRMSIRSTYRDTKLDAIQWSDYKKLGQEAGMLFIGVLIGMLASQMDRIVLSKYVDTASFGVYVIVANLGLAVMQLQHPLIRAFLPRITQDLASNNHSSLKHLALGVLLLCIFPCLVLALLSPWILQVWIESPAVVEEGALPLSLLFCAVAFNALYQLIYQRILVLGDGIVAVKINLIILVVLVPLLVLTVPNLGIVSGALYWLLMTLIQLFLGFLWLKNHPLPH